MQSFTRIEKKFPLSKLQYQKLIEVISNHGHEDEYGTTTVTSLYYDDDSYSLIRQSIEKPHFKEKLRIRTYADPATNPLSYIEIKRKLNGYGYKRRMSLPWFDAIDFLERSTIPSSPVNSEISQFQLRYKTSPKIYVSYIREAYVCSDLRITFDHKIQYHLADQTVIHDLECSDYLMEVKGDSMPDWLYKSCSTLKIYQAPFSKIGAAYTQAIRKGEIKCSIAS